MSKALSEIGSGLICLIVIAAMVAENPWAILLIVFCALWS
jgi:hypothetical protein